MIELPRAALMAADIAQTAEFFSFGTNDLTQTTFGISRDDAASFLGAYMARGILAADPFVSLDREGVGELIRIGVERGRARPAQAQGRHLRRARRRPRLGRVLSRDRARLCVVLAVPGADRAARRRAGGARQGGGEPSLKGRSSGRRVSAAFGALTNHLPRPANAAHGSAALPAQRRARADD